MRWIFIVLLMCNGIYFLWQNYLQQKELPVASEAASQLSADVPLLALLAEEPQKLAPQSTQLPLVKKGEAGNSEVQAADNPRICWRIGPFREEISGKQVVGRLAALDIHLTLQAEEVQDKPDYWVHIAPQPTRREAIKLLRELQAKKIDSFLIAEGELANGISLGFFTQKDRAELVYNKRRQQGYQATIKEVPRTHTELWAVFDEGEYGKFSDALWQKIIEGNQGLERRKNYCDKIASPENID